MRILEYFVLAHLSLAWFSNGVVILRLHIPSIQRKLKYLDLTYKGTV